MYAHKVNVEGVDKISKLIPGLLHIGCVLKPISIKGGKYYFDCYHCVKIFIDGRHNNPVKTFKLWYKDNPQFDELGITVIVGV